MPHPSILALLSCALVLLLLTPAVAQTCPSSYFFNGQRCAPCLPNCQCSQENTCSSCLSGYTYDALFQNCLQCPVATGLVNIGCQECCYQVKGPAFVCSTCQAGPYVFQIGGQCINMQGCLAITTQGACTQCTSSFFLNQGSCVGCDPSCATCNDLSLCLTCATGYYNATNVDYSMCQACSLGCQACTSSTVCTSCGSGYRLATGSCTACSSSCLACSATVCTTCNQLSGLISGICYLCTDTSKQGSAGCLTCTSNGVRIQCTSCSPGYYLNTGTQACVACSLTFPNSILCTATTVLQCSNDNSATLTSRYLLVSNQCVANTNKCKDMLDSTGKCSSCYFTSNGYYSLSGAGVCSLCNVAGCATYSSACQCLSCQNGYQYINNQCIQCQNLHCYQCQASISSCQSCAPAYGRLSSACLLCQPANCNNCDGDNTVCTQCNTGYYLSNGQCYQCQTNCLTCTSNVLCSSCAANNFLQANGRCKALPANCIQIDNSTLASNIGSCKRCSYGYILISGNCYPCSSSLFNVSNF
jgi:hypothetical protein